MSVSTPGSTLAGEYEVRLYSIEGGKQSFPEAGAETERPRIIHYSAYVIETKNNERFRNATTVDIRQMLAHDVQ